MTKKYSISTFFILTILLFSGVSHQSLMAQSNGVEIKGVVKESGTSMTLSQVSISVSSTGASSKTDSVGEFTLVVPDLQTEIIVNLPGYNKRNIFLNGRDFVELSLVSSEFHSFDNLINLPLGPMTKKNSVYPVNSLSRSDMDLSITSSFDQALQGKVPGLSVIKKSGMPGQRTYMNIRGYSSLFAKSEPLLFIDGMIHEYAYAGNSLMEGFALNPMDVVDIEDINDITVSRDGVSYLGGLGSNGALYVNTEQKAEASTVIKFSAYGGMTMKPEKQQLLSAAQFSPYFNDVLSSQGYDQGQIDAMYPWLNGDASSEEYYRYNNNTDWQDEILKPSAVSKFHFFLKGGDNIATYNISTGYLSHNGIYDDSKYTRFNLRINGKVNITDRFSITPNVKLSLADSKLANHGPSMQKNPMLATSLKPGIMTPYARDAATGEPLTYYDDVGVFNVSNPSAVVENAQGENRNYHFLSSIRADYKFNEHWNLYTMIGINFNNARENLFLPDLGIVQTDSAYNQPGDFVYEYRSTQNHTALTYNTTTTSGHSFLVNAGLKYMQNSYKYNLSLDLNTPSDDFKSLGDGSQYSFLRSTTGDNREISYISYFADLNYNFRNKYFLSSSVAYDGTSVTNENNRYNLYPSIGAAWRLSSEGFLNQVSWLEDLKLRGSYAITGNIFSSVYDYSKLYYTDRRMNGDGVLTREVIPNDNLELEKKSTINAGLDLSLLKQALNLHADYFVSNVNNLIIQQEIPSTFGYDTYFDNGGQLQVSGVELGIDARVQSGDFTWRIGASVTNAATTITSLEFLNPDQKHIITSIPGGEMITSMDNPINAYYGYETVGIISAAEAGTVTGPKGIPMQAGDMKYRDFDGNNIIDENDKTIIGDPNADLFGGLFTSFAYKGFELYINFTYSQGNDVYNYMRYKTEAMDAYYNQSLTVLDRWTDSNTGASMPRIGYGDPAGNAEFSDRWIEDGSFIRLEQLTLNYTINPESRFFKGAVVYLTATNLLTFTKYTGYDPEFVYTNNPFYKGVDYGMMPQSKSFIIGLKLNL